MKTTASIAHRMVAMLRQQQAYQELFADNAESIDLLYASEPPLKV